MYHLEEFKNKVSTKNYLENYVDVTVFLERCRQCGCFGKNWSCPPHGFDPEESWRKHKYFYITGTKVIFDQSIKEEMTGKEETGAYIRQIFLQERKTLLERLLALEKKYPGSIGLSAGECFLCDECARTAGKTCLHPDKMRHSIESLGGNVVKTAEEFLGIELKWAEGKLPEYLTLVTGLLTDDPDAEI